MGEAEAVGGGQDEREGGRVKRRILEVRWRDSTEGSGWRSEEQAQSWAASELQITTVGYVFAEDKHWLTLCSTQSQSGNVLSLLSIPKGCILQRKVLR